MLDRLFVPIGDALLFGAEVVANYNEDDVQEEAHVLELFLYNDYVANGEHQNYGDDGGCVGLLFKEGSNQH